MSPAVTVSKSVRAIPDQVVGLQPAAEDGENAQVHEGFRVGGGRKLKSNGRKQRTAPQEESSLGVRSDWPRSSRLSELRWNASTRRTKSWRSKLNFRGSNSSRIKEERVKELSAATAESDISHAEQLARCAANGSRRVKLFVNSRPKARTAA
jgi:hypothetical protein